MNATQFRLFLRLIRELLSGPSDREHCWEPTEVQISARSLAKLGEAQSELNTWGGQV